MAHQELAFLPRADLAGLQQEQLSVLLDALLPGNRFYAQKFADAGLSRDDIKSPQDLRRLPFTTKADLARDQENYPPYGTDLTYALKSYTRLHQTSGTHGAPLRWLDTPQSWERLKRCWSQIFAIVEVEQAGDRLCFPFSFGPFLGFWTAFEAADDVACLKLATGGMSSLARLRFILDNQATVLVCTPTYALHLADVAQKKGIALTHSTPGYMVRAVIVAGEPGGSIPATRARMQEAWQARVFDHHGMTEVGPMSVECPHAPGGLHILEGDYLIEVIDPVTGADVSPGNIGELVVTNLGRVGSPVLRYRTGDLVRIDPRPCPCGRTFMRLEGGVLGRTDDMISIRGNNVYPSALEEVIRRFRDVAEYRVEIDTSAPLAALRIEIEPEKEVPTTEYAALGASLAQALRDDLLFRAEVVVAAPGSLPRFEMKAHRIRKKV
jgi:phenylacetate-CoA ligase